MHIENDFGDDRSLGQHADIERDQLLRAWRCQCCTSTAKVRNELQIVGVESIAAVDRRADSLLALSTSYFTRSKGVISTNACTR